jgi:hypothetical protein
MTTKQEILDAVGYQHSLVEKDGKYSVFYLQINDYSSPVEELSMSINSDKIDCALSEDEMISEVESLLGTFPVYKLIDGPDELVTVHELKVKNDIATKALRGAGNTKFRNALYYKGEQSIDSPVIVAESGGKYGVFKHPNFEKYGYVLEA